jgi:peptide/nickel transport system permease protein
MRQYILKRLLLVIPTLFLVTAIVFTLSRLIPGDVVAMMVEENTYAKDLEEMRAKLGLNRPIYVQYFVWLGQVVQGNLGESLWTRRPVLGEILRRLPVSMELGLMAILFALLLAIPIGILSAARQDTLPDYTARSLAIGGLSVPGFWLATLVVVLPSIWFRWTPPIQHIAFRDDPWKHLVQFAIPAMILGFASAASLMRLTRAMLLEVLRQDYVRTAWAKGLRERVVLLKHALRNAMLPVITVLGLQTAQVAGGTVVMESIFGLPGMGRFLLEAISYRDYPVISGVNLVLATIVVASNLAVDLAYAYIDPRIYYR